MEEENPHVRLVTHRDALLRLKANKEPSEATFHSTKKNNLPHRYGIQSVHCIGALKQRAKK